MKLHKNSLDSFCKRYCEHYTGYNFKTHVGQICPKVNLAGNGRIINYFTPFIQNLKNVVILKN